MLVPTRELALQVHDVLAPLADGRRLPARRRLRRRADWTSRSRLSSDGVEVIVATPGRLIDLVDRERRRRSTDIELVVLDEADRMADMGFLPQVEWILRHIDGPHQTLLFSATLDGAVDALVAALPARPRVPRGREPTRSPSRRWPTASCSSTRWTR